MSITGKMLEIAQKKYLRHPSTAHEIAVKKQHAERVLAQQQHEYLSKMRPPAPSLIRRALISSEYLQKVAEQCIAQDLSRGTPLEEVVDAFNTLPFTKQLLDRMLKGDGI